MRTIHTMKVWPLMAVLSVINYAAFSQSLDLDEIFKVRTLDSIALEKFCSDKGFKLKEKKQDNWIYSHSYYSPANSAIWFIRTFPKDTTANRFVYYYFDDTKTFSGFKKKLKENGFTFKRKNEKDYGGYKATHNIYLTTDNEVDLVSEKNTGQPMRFFLLHYRRVN